jgi:hypothetical protein
MLNTSAKLLLVASSLSPVLGAVAINQFVLGKSVGAWLPWLVIAILLVVICWGLLKYAAGHAQRHKLTVEQFEDNNKEVLAFLLAYLLPLVSVKDTVADIHWLTGAYVLIIILVVFTHARAFHFNPVMGLLGYYFYGLKQPDGTSLLLITRKEAHRSGEKLETVCLAHNIYLHIGGDNA